MSRDSASRTLSAPTKLYKQSPTSSSTVGSLPLLAKRDLTCGDDYHNCLDINQPDKCCDNQSYCYVNWSNAARCCPIGSNCVSDSPCNSDFYYCTTTLTGITTGNATTKGCCGRKCPQTSYYLCPSSLGGKCCPFDADCQTGGNCVMKRSPSTATTTPAASSGHDTCSTCTPTSSERVSVIEFDGLSSGAKAGIGVGVALGTSLLIALLAWSLILYRRHRRQADASRAELTGSDVPGGQGAAASRDGSDPKATTPVEMAENEAEAPPKPERSVSPWENTNVESIDGLFELDASQIHDAEPEPSPPPPPPPPPEPNVYFPSHLGNV